MKAGLVLRRWAFASPQGTLLVLDEPTNHLDIPSKEMLEEALQRFDGSVIAVSHDRYFLRRIATRVVTVPCSSLPLSVSCPTSSEVEGSSSAFLQGLSRPSVQMMRSVLHGRPPSHRSRFLKAP